MNKKLPREDTTSYQLIVGDHEEKELYNIGKVKLFIAGQTTSKLKCAKSPHCFEPFKNNKTTK